MVHILSQDDELEVTKDSGISLDELRPTLPQPQVLKDVEHSVREREITTFKPSSRVSINNKILYVHFI